MTTEGTQISVSTTFFPAALLPGTGGAKTDVIIHTSDSVFFYVHMNVLRSKSSNNFGETVPSYGSAFGGRGSQHGSSSSTSMGDSYQSSLASPSSLHTVAVTENSVVFNVILHMVYGMSCQRYAPSLDTLFEVLINLPKYGLPPPEANDKSEIPQVLARHAPSEPLRVYALAASQGLEAICVLTSQYTLQTTLDKVAESDALVMGPIYLRRLFFLHMGVVEALKRILRAIPEGHLPSASCSSEEQAAVARTWGQGVGAILLQVNVQATTAQSLVAHLGATSSSTTCRRCKEHVQSRISEVVREWIAIRKTI